MLDIPRSLYREPKILEDIKALKRTLWVNPDQESVKNVWESYPFTMSDIDDAEKRLERFAPLLMQYFEEVRETNGIIESPLKKIPAMEERLKERHLIKGQLYVKLDSHLAIAGSIKARGGIYEVLKRAEDLALAAGILKVTDDYSKLAEPKYRDFFSQYDIQVGSTGNLGLSIGIISATLGFDVTVHMSADAKSWKKDLLRQKGARVIEYDSDYTEAVRNGRLAAEVNDRSYFIDDENSSTLFMGYAVAAKRLIKQLEEEHITVDADHPLFVYLPCGVGGAAGGITFGLKKLFGDHVHSFFVEPARIPSVLIGMATVLNEKISVKDYGLDGVTEADGLACPSPSALVGKVMKPLLSGIFTVKEHELFNYLRELAHSEGLYIEPSSCSAFEGVARLYDYPAGRDYLAEWGLDEDKMTHATHIAWATGGRLVPKDVMDHYLETYIDSSR